MKLTTPAAGVTTDETGLDGRAVAGPSTEAGFVVWHTGLISEAVGAAGLPGICGDPAPVPHPGQTATVVVVPTATATMAANHPFTDGDHPLRF